MPRTYKPKKGGKRYVKHDPAKMEKAVTAVKSGMTVRKASEKYEYEGELFPGQVASCKENGCVIKAMEKSGVNWKWPKQIDEMFYLHADIKQKINQPQEMKRGILVVPEMRDRWG